MKKYLVIFVVLMSLYLAFTFASGKKMTDLKDLDLSVKPKDIQPGSGIKPDIDFGNIPLYFITNKGQVNEKAKFYAKASRYTLWLTKDGLVFDSVKKVEVKAEKTHPAPSGHPSQEGNIHIPHPYRTPKIERDVSRLIFLDADKSPEIVPVEEAKLRVNYFIGNDKSKWHGDIPTSMVVLYKNLYKNIDLKVYGIEKQVEYDWIVKVGGDPGDIKFRYKNVKGTRIDEEGNLLIETDFGKLMHKKPVSYQEIGMERKDIDVKFKKIAENTYGFEAGAYDRSRDLIIDPVVLVYSTYLGGGNDECGYGIAVDDSGNVYVTGYTSSTDFPTLDQYQGDQRGYDVFVTKLDPTQSGASSLLYSTYLGGGFFDKGLGIAVDGSGNAYVTGATHSMDFPTLNQYQGDQGGTDVFVAKLDPTQSGASSLLYSTYLGGNLEDWGYGIAVDGSGNAYVTGCTLSTNFPTLNQYQGYQGSYDVFVTRLDPTQSGTSGLIYSTYVGGGSQDYGYGIAVDSNRNAYVTGETNSTDFPTLNQYQEAYQGNSDVFVTKLDSTQSGTAGLLYSTYLGGGSTDKGLGIAVDSSGNAYVTGATYGTDFPTLNQYQGDQGGIDAFVTRLDPTQSGASSLLYSTYLGGVYNDFGYAIAVDGNRNAYVTGDTRSSDFPTLNQYQGYQGSYDAFVSKFSFGPSNEPPTAICQDIKVAATENCEAYITTADVDGGSYDPDEGDEISLSLDNTGPFSPGAHYVELTVTDQNGESDSCFAQVIVIDQSSPVISISDPLCVQVGNGMENMANKLSLTVQDNCSDTVDLQILNVEVYNNGGNLVNGQGIFEVMDNDIYVYPDGNGWSVVVTVEAVDENGNAASETFSKNLLACKK